jgi:hypothetical protein
LTIASAIWERQELPVHKKSTRDLSVEGFLEEIRQPWI